jgi:hypothetical protein
VDSTLSYIFSSWNNVGQTVVEGLPTAIFFIERWIYEWQTLIAGFCAIIAARIWGRAVIRAAELGAGMPLARPSTPREIGSSTQSSAIGDLRAGIQKTGSQLGSNPIGRLRTQIRLILGRVPCIDEKLTLPRLDLCKEIGTFSLAETSLRTEGSRRSYAALRDGLSTLGALDHDASCRTAWQALTAVNKHARDLEALVYGASRQAVN